MPGTGHSVETAREACGSVWGSARVDKFKSTKVAAQKRDEKAERVRIMAAMRPGGTPTTVPPAGMPAAMPAVTPGAAAAVGAAIAHSGHTYPWAVARGAAIAAEPPVMPPTAGEVLARLGVPPAAATDAATTE